MSSFGVKMKKLVIYGEDHDDPKDIERKKQFEQLANEDIIIFIKECMPLDLVRQRKIYGVEEELLHCYTQMRLFFIGMYTNINRIMANEGLSQEEIPDFIERLDQLIQKEDNEKYKQLRQQFTKSIVKYIEFMFYLRDFSFAKAEIIVKLKENRLEYIFEDFESYFNYIPFDYKREIDIGKFDVNFFRMFFRIKDKLTNILLSMFVNKMKRKYGGNVDHIYLEIENLTAHLAKPNSKFVQDHDREIILHLRDDVFADNLLRIVNANKDKKYFVFVVGDDHVKWLQFIFGCREKCLKEMIGLKIDFFSKIRLEDFASMTEPRSELFEVKRIEPISEYKYTDNKSSFLFKPIPIHSAVTREGSQVDFFVTSEKTIYACYKSRRLQEEKISINISQSSEDVASYVSLAAVSYEKKLRLIRSITKLGQIVHVEGNLRINCLEKGAFLACHLKSYH